jgi:6-phosphogluconolactonase
LAGGISLQALNESDRKWLDRGAPALENSGMATQFRFFTGSYTRIQYLPHSCGEGIRHWVLDAETGALGDGRVVSDATNPSYVALSPCGTRLAAVSERDGEAGRVLLFELAPDGALQPLRDWEFGSAPCHAAFTPDGRHLWAAAYGTGEVMRIAFGEGDTVSRVFRYTGSSVNPARQKAPHAHQIAISGDGAWVYVCDLGSDTIWQHAAAGDGPLDPVDGCRIPAGEGPRHMALHPGGRHAYALAELTGRVHLLDRDPASGRLTHREALDSLPGDWDGEPSGAAIRLHPAGDRLYASNRNHGSIACFGIAENGARLDLRGRIQLADDAPRDFTISPDGCWLVAGGQSGGTLEVMPLDPASGLPSGPGRTTPCGTPVCIVWI